MTMSNVFCLVCNVNIDVSSSINIFYTSLPHNGELLGSFLSRVLRLTVSDLCGSYICSQCYNLFQMLDQAQRTVTNIRCEILKIYRFSERKKSVKRALNNDTDLKLCTNPVFIECKPDVSVIKNEQSEEQTSLNPLQIEETIEQKCTQDRTIDQNLNIPNIVSSIDKSIEDSKTNCKGKVNEYNNLDSTISFDYTNNHVYIKSEEIPLSDDNNVCTTTTLQEKEVNCSQSLKEVEEKVTKANENSENTAGTDINQLQIPSELGKISKYHLKPLKFSCPTCGKKFRTAAEQRSHINSHSTLRPYMCEKCGKAYKHKYALEIHVGMHNGINPFQCSICKKSFTQKGALIRHIPIHTDEMPYQCELCGKRFKHRTSYTSHKLTHSEERSYKCPTCDMRFRSANGVKKHLLVHTGEKPYSCSLCGNCFSRRGNLRVHQKIHDPLSQNKGRRRKVQYKCDHCNLVFEKKQNLETHVNCHATMNNESHIKESCDVSHVESKTDKLSKKN